jgi:hypothetical protein
LVIICPRRAAIPLAVLRTVVCPAGFLRWRVKADVTDVDSRSDRHGERLNGAIKVLIIKRVLIVPRPGIWSRHLVTHEPDAIVTRIRLDLVHGRAVAARPNRDGRVHLHGASSR